MNIQYPSISKKQGKQEGKSMKGTEGPLVQFISAL